MKVVIFALGSRGDVQPFLALAVGLQRAGHQVTLSAPYNFTDWIQSYGIHTHPVSWSIEAFLKEPKNQAALKSRNLARVIQTMRGLEPGFIQANDDFWQAGLAAEFVVQTIPLLCGVEVAQQRGVPMAVAYAAPVYAPPTRAFPSFGLPTRFSLGGNYNYLTHDLLSRIPGALQPLNRWRASRLRLPPIRPPWYTRLKPGTPALYGYSPNVLPKPADWDEFQHITGYWFLDAPSNWQPSADLLHFLESGPPPVYIGFGSMSDEDPERLTRLTLRALEMTGQRGILATGWGGITQLASSTKVYFLDNAPHDWLFPRMAAVLHHGGAGTTGAGLRAGVPSIVTPFGLDQFAWADLVMRLGVGPRAGDMRKLTAEKLAAAIRATVTDSTMRARAAELGAKIRAEDGIGRAVEIIEHHAAAFVSR